MKKSENEIKHVRMIKDFEPKWIVCVFCSRMKGNRKCVCSECEMFRRFNYVIDGKCSAVLTAEKKRWCLYFVQAIKETEWAWNIYNGQRVAIVFSLLFGKKTFLCDKNSLRFVRCQRSISVEIFSSLQAMMNQVQKISFTSR